MHHDTPLITTIVAGLVLAYIFGMIANRFKLPPLVGYLFAGILVGPHTPGFVADQALGAELAELGVILLMFGVGLHFSLKDLMSVRALAIPGALVQIAFATLLGLGLAMLMGWGIGAGLLFGLALSVASTVVLLKALQDRRLIDTERGRIAVGWLIVEDLAMVLALVLVPAIASLYGTDTGVHDPFVSFVERIINGPVGIWGVLGLTIVKVAAFVGFMLIVGRRIIPWGLHATAHTGSRELFRLAVLAIALGVALGSAVLFGVSLALGAFFAGMILSESELSHRAAQETLPLRDAFAVLFFVSVGMLFDPMIIVTNPLPVLGTVFIIVIGKSLAAFGIVLLFKRPVATALTISASLAQIGEFSFILASMGVALAILPPEGQDLILAGALISIVLNPLVFWGVDLVKPRFEARVAQRRAARAEHDGVRIEPTDRVEASVGPITSDAPNDPAIIVDGAIDDDTIEPTKLTDHTVLVGYGQVGRIIADGLQAAGAPLLVIEDSDNDVAAAREAGLEVLFGNAASIDVLKLANLQHARSLMVAISNGFEAGTVCESGRKLNPGIRIITRAYSEDEDTHLRSLGANIVIRGEREIGMGMLAYARGEGAPAVVPVDVPPEPKLPPAENVLAKAAALPVVAEVVKAVVVEEPVVLEVVEGNVSETLIELPGPTAEAVLDSVEAIPEVEGDIAETEAAELKQQEADQISEGGIAPPAEDIAAEEAAVAEGSTAEDAELKQQEADQVSEGSIAPPAEDIPADEAASVESPAEADTELKQQESDEISEGGIAPPAADVEAEEKPAARIVPLVVPEPKG
ncbi:CPA2 family monovalent cation:H+ antiporter-2 [Devosia sp. 2618]